MCAILLRGHSNCDFGSAKEFPVRRPIEAKRLHFLCNRWPVVERHSFQMDSVCVVEVEVVVVLVVVAAADDAAGSGSGVVAHWPIAIALLVSVSPKQADSKQKKVSISVWLQWIQRICVTHVWCHIWRHVGHDIRGMSTWHLCHFNIPTSSYKYFLLFASCDYIWLHVGSGMTNRIYSCSTKRNIVWKFEIKEIRHLVYRFWFYGLEIWNENGPYFSFVA